MLCFLYHVCSSIRSINEATLLTNGLSNSHRNFLWADYVQTHNERFQYMISFLQQNMKLTDELQKRGDRVATGIKERFQTLVSKTATAESLLQGISEEPTWEQARESLKQSDSSPKSTRDIDFSAKKVQQYKDFNLMSRQIPIGHANLLIPLTLSCLRQPDSAEFVIGSLTLPDYFYKATSVLLDEISRILHQDECSGSNNVLPVAICWPQHDYSFLGGSGFVAVPPCDTDRCYFWTNIIHETFHGKTREINVLENTSSRANSQQETKQQVTDTGNNKDSLIDLWTKARIKIALELKAQTLGAHIEWSWRRTDGTDRYLPPLAYYFWQVNELLCDIATVKICGLPDVLVKGVLWAPSLRNPLYAVDRYLEDPTHPPDAVRVWYMIETLKLNDMGYSQSELSFLEQQLEELKGFDSTYVPNILDILQRTFKPYIPAISNFVSELVNKEYFFTAEKWRKLKEEYSNSTSISSVLDAMNAVERARCLIGIAWLKRIEIHEMGKVGNSEYDIEKFKQAHKDEKKFFVDLVKLMAKIPDCYNTPLT